MAIEDPAAQPAKERQDRRHPLVITLTRIENHQTVYQDHITPAEQRQIVELAETLDRVHRRVIGETQS